MSIDTDRLLPWQPLLTKINKSLEEMSLEPLQNWEQQVISKKLDDFVLATFQDDSFTGKKVSGLDLREEYLKYMLPSMARELAAEYRPEHIHPDYLHWTLQRNANIDLSGNLLEKDEVWVLYKDGKYRYAYDNYDYTEGLVKGENISRVADNRKTGKETVEPDYKIVKLTIKREEVPIKERYYKDWEK